jgi:hypothetical protein
MQMETLIISALERLWCRAHFSPSRLLCGCKRITLVVKYFSAMYLPLGLRQAPTYLKLIATMDTEPRFFSFRLIWQDISSQSLVFAR